MVTPVLVTTVLLGWLVYSAANEALSEASIRAVAIAANAREQALVTRLERQSDRIAAFLKAAAAQCPGSEEGQSACLHRNLAEFVTTEQALAAALVAGSEPILQGAEASALVGTEPFPPGQLARFTSGSAAPRSYDIVVHEGGLRLAIRFGGEVINQIFQDRYGLGRSGETFLADSRGVFITEPKYHGHSGESDSHPIDARPMRQCLAGNSAEMLAPDYRHVPVIHGFRFIEEIGGGCIMAHIEQQEAFAPARALRTKVAGTALGLAVFMVALSFVFARRVSLPMSRLTARARALQSGDFQSAVPREGVQELQTFADTFETMARSLQQASTERERLYQQAQEAVRIREDVVAIVSHDLRNPLNAISMSATLLLKDNSLEDRQAKNLSRISSAADRANRMIRDLLDFTQARVEGIPIQPQACDLHELLRRVVEEVQSAHPERHLECETVGNGQGAWDCDRMAQVVANLVGNAVQHSPPGTPVRISSRADAGLVFTVHNLGAPIAPEVLPTLFEPFQRGSATGRGTRGSVGLGLFIALQIVQAHGGTIEVASIEAEGTLFTVRLPQRQAE